VTIGVLATRHVRNSRARATFFVATATVLVLVGVSRVYVGVHYPTDVASGIALGLAWALLLAGFFGRIEYQRGERASVAEAMRGKS
jgi:undecaprenyl-diphosphatase